MSPACLECFRNQQHHRRQHQQRLRRRLCRKLDEPVGLSIMSIMIIGTLIGFVMVVAYALILIKAHWSVRIVVSALLIIGSIRLTALWTATRERNTIWNRSGRPLGIIFTIAQQDYLRRGRTNEVDSMLSRLNEGDLLSGTFFGRTNYPVDYDDLFKPLNTMNSASRGRQ